MFCTPVKQIFLKADLQSNVGRINDCDWPISYGYNHAIVEQSLCYEFIHYREINRKRMVKRQRNKNMKRNISCYSFLMSLVFSFSIEASCKIARPEVIASGSSRAHAAAGTTMTVTATTGAILFARCIANRRGTACSGEVVVPPRKKGAVF